MTKRFSGTLVAVALLVPLLLPRSAAAQHAAHAAPLRALGPPDATVLAIDSGDLVVDLGALKGAHEGQVVELWRPVRLRHPVTGQPLSDRFRLGTIRLSQVQPTLALAKVEATLLRPPATGDHVIVRDTERPTPRAAGATTSDPVRGPAPSAGAREQARPPAATADARPTPTRASDTNDGAPADSDAQALGDLFSALEGADPSARAAAYESFVRARPRSRYARVLREEIAALRARTSTPVSRAEAPYESSFSAIHRLRPGVPQRFAVELDPRFVGAVVHVRRRGRTAYRSLSMERVGATYWAATLPGDAIGEPATEYFVEGVVSSGRSVPVIGTAMDPKDAPVDPHRLTGKQPGTLAQMQLWSEYASFNARAANDFVFQTEGTFGWRLRDEGIRAVRSGFGVLRGKGGTLEQLDALGLPPKAVGLTYGYVEAEIGITKNYGLVGRPILGLREGGIAGGAQGFVRVGNDLKTNLLVGGEILGTVGIRGIVQLEWRTIPRVPVMLRSEVTNQPAGTNGDVGARAIAQVGYELVQDLTVSGRLSYQGRTIDHAGPGAGLGVSYQW